MNAEKKLGLAFVGILSVSFCGVLTMRLLDANKAEQIDINVGSPVASAPEFAPPKPDAVATAEPAKPASPARFANATTTGADKTAGYLPPLPKNGTTPGMDSRYGGATAAAPTSGMPPNGLASNTAATNSTPAGVAGYSTGSRYGTPGGGAAIPSQAIPPASNTAGNSGRYGGGGYGNGSERYGTPTSTASNALPSSAMPTSPTMAKSATPPSFASATPTAAATLSPPTAHSNPYGSSQPSAPASNAFTNSSPTTSSAGSSDNPLRSSRPEATSTANTNSASTGSANFATPAAGSSPYGTPASAYPSYVNSLPSRAAPNIPSESPAAPSIPTTAMPTAPFASAAAPANTSASNTSAMNNSPTTRATANVLREPRAFDASAAASQPLAVSAPNIPQPGVAALGAPPQGGSGFNNSLSNNNALRASGTMNSSNDGGVAPAAATLPVAAAPAAVRNTPYVVAPDDNFWKISNKVYGDGSYYRALFAYNSDRYQHAEDVRVGSVLDVPPAEVLKQRYPELFNNAVAADGRPTDVALAGGRPTATAAANYTVREGDTLFDIARRQLGKASRWTELYELNRQTLGDNLENLRPGTQLVLPQ